jgi:hypothetical protein
MSDRKALAREIAARSKPRFIEIKRELAELSRLHASTIHRMEASGPESVRGQARNLERVIRALEKKGVEITPDGVKLIKGRK